RSRSARGGVRAILSADRGAAEVPAPPCLLLAVRRAVRENRSVPGEVAPEVGKGPSWRRRHRSRGGADGTRRRAAARPAPTAAASTRPSTARARTAGTAGTCTPPSAAVPSAARPGGDTPRPAPAPPAGRNTANR